MQDPRGKKESPRRRIGRRRLQKGNDRHDPSQARVTGSFTGAWQSSVAWSPSGWRNLIRSPTVSPFLFLFPLLSCSWVCKPMHLPVSHSISCNRLSLSCGFGYYFSRLSPPFMLFGFPCFLLSTFLLSSLSLSLSACLCFRLPLSASVSISFSLIIYIIYLPIKLIICRFIFLCLCLFVSVSLSPSICPSISIHLSSCLPIYLSISFPSFFYFLHPNSPIL